MNTRVITPGSISRVLIAGFSLVIILLLAAGFIGIRNIQSIKENAASLVQEQRVSTRLIGEIQQEQSTLSAVFYKLARDPDTVNYKQILPQLDMIDANMERIADEARGTPQERLWSQLNDASKAFSVEARRLLTATRAPTLASRDLFRRHEQVISIISRLVGDSYLKVTNAQYEIDRRSERLRKESIILLGASLLLALITTVLTVRVTAELFRRMEWQTGELSRVSWHMLKGQESIARRFSHELHDELGQSLTAVKANLAALNFNEPQSRSRVQDCVHLVDEAIGNVRQLSQLLRPTILDDFGLDAGVRWLCDGFRQRTGIDVEFVSNLTARLPEDTETHLFRIAQEALTNVARHSGAKKVIVELNSEDHAICLVISDDGRGLPAPMRQPSRSLPQRAEMKSLGMIGMRARARAAGGELRLSSSKMGGLRIEVEIPVLRGQHEKHPSFAG
ncbi:MAG: histidine kinase [Acidobacteriota bacterium]|nr:histidine kinase [Acidobacteriota bacterium]